MKISKLIRDSAFLSRSVQKYKAKITAFHIAIEIGILIFSIFLSGALNTFKRGLKLDIPNFFLSLFSFETLKNTFMIFIIITIVFWVYRAASQKVNGGNTNDEYIASAQKTYGKGQILPEHEYSKFLGICDHPCEVPKGYIIGRSRESRKIVYIPKTGAANRNMAICGPPGCQKTTKVLMNLIPSAANMGHSLIITDPKGELTSYYYDYFKELGYKNVWQLNFNNFEASNGWDMLAEIDYGSIDVLCSTIIKNTGTSKDVYFSDITELYLKSLMLYVYEINPEGKKTMGEVYRLLETKQVEEIDDLFFALAKINPKSKALGVYNQLPDVKDKARAKVNLGGRLKLFGDDSLKEMLGTPEIDLSKVASEKTVIFCGLPAENTTYNFIISTFINVLFQRVYDNAKASDRKKCDVPVDFFLDEFPSVCDIPDFGGYLSTARGFDIGIAFIFQSIPQIKDKFGPMLFDHYLGTCSYNFCLGANDNTTAKYYSDLSRNATVDVSTIKKEYATIRVSDYKSHYSQSTGQGKRPVLLPDNILNLAPEDSKMYLFVQGHDPLELDKMGFWEVEEALVAKYLNSYKIMPPRNGGDEEAYEQLKENATYIVSDYQLDDGSYLYTRDELIQKANKVMRRYIKDGCTPNGQKLIIDGRRIYDPLDIEVTDDPFTKRRRKNVFQQIKSKRNEGW